MNTLIDEYRNIALKECEQALSRIDNTSSYNLLNAIMDAEKVFFVGVGRVLLSLQAICKRFSHLGIDAHYVGEITEPAITKQDLLIVGSGSGESLFPKVIAEKAKTFGAKVAWIGSNMESAIANLADIRVRIPVQTKLNREDELQSQQPMTSLFEQSLLLYGDIIANLIVEKKSLELSTLWEHHANLE